MHVLGDLSLVYVILHFDLVLYSFRDIWKKFVLLKCKDHIDQFWSRKEKKLMTVQSRQSERQTR